MEQGNSFKKVFPDAHPDALDLLEKMLKFDPRRRITVEDALRHPYVASIRCEEPSALSKSPCYLPQKHRHVEILAVPLEQHTKCPKLAVQCLLFRDLPPEAPSKTNNFDLVLEPYENMTPRKAVICFLATGS